MLYVIMVQGGATSDPETASETPKGQQSSDPTKELPWHKLLKIVNPGSKQVPFSF